MSNAAKLKKKAAEFEQKKQLDKALALYRQILDEADPDDPDLDAGLFNRVGDLLLRQGTVADAVNYYERAVDLYAEGGFFNNAIALCNKILRQSPGRNSIYYKLGKISAKKGFNSDAKQNFLEYADRMQKAGQLDEAFRALKEFADLCPEQDDIRLMLAEQLAKRERKTEALDQLQTLYERYDGEGRDAEARATLERMKAIDPEAQPRTGGEGKKAGKSNELVFLEVDYDAGPARRPAPRATVKLPTPHDEGTIRTTRPSPISDLPLIDPGPDLPYESAPDAPLDPAAFGAMRLGTPMDVPAVEQVPEHDLALPGELPALEPSAPAVPDALELVTPVDSSALVDEVPSLDGLVPPIARNSSARPSLDAGDLDIQRTAADLDFDVTALEPSPDLGVESTMLDDVDVASPPVAPLAGFEQTTFGEDADAGMTLDIEPEPDDDGLLMIGDEEATLDDDGRINAFAPTDDLPVEGPPAVAPDDAARTTRRLTPAEIAALDEAARRGVRAREATDFGAMELTVDAQAHAHVHEDVTLEIEDDDRMVLVDDVPESQHDALESHAESAPHAPALDDLPLLDDADATPLDLSPAVESAEAGRIDGDAFELVGDLPVGEDAPAAAGGAARLAARVAAEPENWALRREWAEALLEAGDREAGLVQLDATMVGAERGGDLELARSIADEVIRVDHDSVRHHQKRVEYAFRTADRPRLIDAYLELADALFRLGQPDKAKVVYQRVLELAPNDLRASAAMSALGDVVPAAPTPPAPMPRQAAPARRYTGDVSRIATPAERIVPVAPAPAPPRAPEPVAARRALSDDDEFVNLGDLLRADEGPKSTRMVVAEEAPTGDEQADFADMLRKFKHGVSQNVDEEDYDSHYDLGVAYKEMGLLDEAIAEFQKALRGPQRRVRTYEALGQCFIEKRQWTVAATILQRAVAEPGQGDEQLVGVLYLLGYALEALQKPQDALMYYQRVFAVDIQFRDVVDRLSAVEKVAR